MQQLRKLVTLLFSLLLQFVFLFFLLVASCGQRSLQFHDAFGRKIHAPSQLGRWPEQSLLLAKSIWSVNHMYFTSQGCVLMSFNRMQTNFRRDDGLLKTNKFNSM